MQPVTSAPLEARTLANGRYRLVAQLGVDGLLSVWRAHDSLVDCQRVIKLLAMAAQPRVRHRFENEARAMARLSHPNIAMVHDIGSEGGQPYVVLELLEGGTVLDWLGRHGPMPARLAGDVMIQVLDGLQSAHSQGVTHRGLKPGNVLLSATGVPKVTDFGLDPVQAAGGPSVCLSPEQRAGAPGDALSDVYAAGVTLRVMVTGREEALSESAMNASPDGLAAVIRTATSADPSARWTSAHEMALALRACQAGLEPVPDTTPSLGSQNPSTPLDPGEPEGTLRPVRAVHTAVDDRGTVPNAPSREASHRSTTIDPSRPEVRTGAAAPFVEIPDEPPVAYVVVPPPRAPTPPVPEVVTSPSPVLTPKAPVVSVPGGASIAPLWVKLVAAAFVLAGLALLGALALSS